MLEAATLLFFPALMVFAAISDLLTMTISNGVSIALAFLFIVMAFACGLPATEIFWHLACGTAMLVLTFGMFARGWIGGGDGDLAWLRSCWRLRAFRQRSRRSAHSLDHRDSKMAFAGCSLGTPMGCVSARAQHWHSLWHRARRRRPSFLSRNRDLAWRRRRAMNAALRSPAKAPIGIEPVLRIS